MIATANQYVVTQDRIRRFSEALDTSDGAMSSWLRDHHDRQIQEQITALEDELRAYDQLISGEVEEIVVERLADLPRALIQARIVSRLDQRGLARAIGYPVQQIARWEQDAYSRVPLTIMQGIAAFLPLRFGDDAVGRAVLSERRARRALREAGLPREIFDRVIVPVGYEGVVRNDEIERRIVSLFGTGAATFAAGKRFDVAPLRFKLPQNAAQDRTRAYAAYVDGLCAIVAETQRRPSMTLPKDWREVRRLLFPTGVVELETAVRQCWSLGIGVLGLKDSIAFHGACRRIDGRATVILKQTSRHTSRALFDLVHEIFHLAAEPGDFGLLEAAETAPERRASQDERRADRFAAMILTNGSLVPALDAVSREARGIVARLSAAVVNAAQAYAIPVGILANLVADNVRANSGSNWWGAAENLQPREDDSWKTIRDVLIQEAGLDRLGPTEHDLLHQVLETSDE